jgi:hypothetical protein
MPKNISKLQITKSILKGIEQAQKDYADFSGGFWLWRAPEYFTVTYIAQQMAKDLGKGSPWYLTMENGAKQAMTDAGAIGRGKLHSKLRSNGRFDLLLWWGSDEPRAPIEVKKQVTQFQHIAADIERIDRVIHRKKDHSKIQFSVMAFYTSCKARSADAAIETVESRINSIFEAAREHVSPETTLTLEKSKIYPEEESAWCAVTLVLTPIKRRHRTDDETP